jgi:phosphate transport system substrate-binding protein
MRKNLPGLLALFLGLLSASGPVGSCLAADTVRINGSGNALDLLKPMVRAYLKTNRDVDVAMEKPLGSSGAIKALLAGALDLVVSSRDLKPEESAQGARLKEYGRTPFVIITEKRVPKQNVTTLELEGIYAGRITQWQNGESVRLVLRPREDIDTHILGGLSPGMHSSLDAAQSRPGMVIAVTDPEAYATVAKTPGGLGATGLVSIIVEKLPLNILSLNGVRPTPKNLANGTYPMYKQISFVTTSRTTPAALKFLNFACSPQGRKIAGNAGILLTGAGNAHP